MLDTLLDLTWRNPLFMLVVIGAIWFVPGIVIRRIAEERYTNSKKEAQAKAISKLYPSKNKTE